MPEDYLEIIFDGLTKSPYKITSPFSTEYNCIAWAVGDSEQWWWPSPDSYWPPGLARENTLTAFIRMFENLGYESCESRELEPGYEKVAIYVGANDTPTHAARQLSSGFWTSKLGKLDDIEHKTLEGLEGQSYGSVAHIMRRRLPSPGSTA